MAIVNIANGANAYHIVAQNDGLVHWEVVALVLPAFALKDRLLG